MGLRQGLDEQSREWAWRLRNRLTLSLPLWKRPLKQPVPGIDLPTSERLARLRRDYPLARWGEVCSRAEWRENLYILDLLDRHLGRPAAPIGPCLDIGTKNGVHFPALASYSGQGWDGIELDAYRRYRNLASRRDHGRFMARPFASRYLSGSLLALHTPTRYRLITWFLPFITEAPLAAWGLPRRFYQPVALLTRAYELLDAGGTLLIVNQGEWERQVQERLFTATGISARDLGRMQSEFSPFRQPRYGWRVDKPTMN